MQNGCITNLIIKNYTEPKPKLKKKKLFIKAAEVKDINWMAAVIKQIQQK